MDIKYQVFLSSTYNDLVDQRKEVIQALLELDCIPVGMELFPAADDDQWTLIKGLIDSCDYYILIVGGRYGSVSKGGLSYTQMEYEYAIEKGIPVISFLHKSPKDIAVGKTDTDPELARKLKEFKDIVEQKMCKYWTSAEELGSVVSRSLVKLIKTKPRPGWIRADQLSSQEANLKILELTQELSELKATDNKEEKKLQSELAQGEEKFEVRYRKADRSKNEGVKVTWDSLFSKTCSILIHEATEETYREQLIYYIQFLIGDQTENGISIIGDNFISILIQFKALGLIEKSNRSRSVKDTATYWKLTKKGDDHLTKLRAIKKKTV